VSDPAVDDSAYCMSFSIMPVWCCVGFGGCSQVLHERWTNGNKSTIRDYYQNAEHTWYCFSSQCRSIVCLS